MLIAKVRGAKLAFVSVGAGPIDAPLSKRFFGWALALADYRSYRDEFSKRLIDSIGFPNPDPVYPDLAHSLEIDETAHPAAIKNRPLVALGPVGYFGPGWPEHDPVVYEAYIDKIAAFVSWLVGRGYDVAFVPGEAHFDQFTIGDVLDRLAKDGIDGSGGRLLRPPIATVGDLVEQLQATDFVVASRFHNLLLAHLLGKPSIAISYQNKIDSLMADAGLAEYCFPAGAFDLDVLKHRFTRMEADRDAIATKLRRRTEVCRAALVEQYDRLFLTVVGASRR
jgi:polysaccharide pyruvyl transferase WcaK-like protein